MSTAEEASNKATVSRFDDVVATGDAELISKTIDELVEPDVLIPMPVPIQATGAQALKQVWAMLRRALPDLHVAVGDVIAEGDRVVSRNTVTGDPPGRVRGVSHQPANPSPTTRSSSSASPAVESRRSGRSSTSSRR